MKTPLLFIPGALVAATLFYGGCATVNTIEPAQTVAQRQVLSDKRVVTDTWLYNRVRPIGLNVATVSTGFLKVQVEVQNRSSFVQAFAYRIEWFDANGMVISTPTTVWIDRQIHGGETMPITGIAPTDTAKDFRIKFIAK
jgi:uncharacterized protein YcfL